MSYTRKFAFDTLRTVDAATLTGSYIPLGGSLAQSAAIAKIVNDSTSAIYISTDGSTDRDYIPAGGFTLYDITANSRHESDSVVIPSGTQISVKGSAGVGIITFTVLYNVTS